MWFCVLKFETFLVFLLKVKGKYGGIQCKKPGSVGCSYQTMYEEISSTGKLWYDCYINTVHDCFPYCS